MGGCIVVGSKLLEKVFDIFCTLESRARMSAACCHYYYNRYYSFLFFFFFCFEHRGTFLRIAHLLVCMLYIYFSDILIVFFNIKFISCVYIGFPPLSAGKTFARRRDHHHNYADSMKNS